MFCSCLYDTIGLSQSCDTKNQCSRYLNDLPGIETGMFEDLTTADQAIYDDVLDKVKRRTIGSFYSEIVEKFRHKFVPNLLLENVVTGRWDQPFVSLTSEAKLFGTAISLKISKYLEAHIDTVEIYVGNAPLTGASIYVYDLERGTLLETVTFDAPSNGFYEVEINSRYMNDQIGILYDGEEILSRETTFFDQTYYQELCRDCGCTFTQGRPVEIDKGGDVIWNNISTEYYPGMVVKYHVGCSLEAFLCQRKSTLAEALQYKMGIEFFIELLASSRINITTLIPRPKLDALMSYCKTHYEKALKTFVDGTTVHDPLCMVCNQTVKKAIIKI